MLIDFAHLYNKSFSAFSSLYFVCLFWMVLSPNKSVPVLGGMGGRVSIGVYSARKFYFFLGALFCAPNNLLIFGQNYVGKLEFLLNFGKFL